MEVYLEDLDINAQEQAERLNTCEAQQAALLEQRRIEFEDFKHNIEKSV